MTRTNLALHDLADGALLVEYPGLSDEEANARAVAAARALGRGALPGFLDAVPGACTLFVEFDPAETSRERLTRLLGKEESAGADASRRTLRIPVVYGGDAGRDLDEVAEAAGLSADEFARRHAQASYRVAFLGFAPGFAYLTGLPAELAAPRLSTPRTRVPAGSVAVAGPYTGIYPGETPGGWRLIGWTDVRLFDPDAHPPSLFLPGDGVRFEPVGREALGVFDRPIARSPDHPFPGIPILRVLSPGVFSSLQGARATAGRVTESRREERWTLRRSPPQTPFSAIPRTRPPSR